jgi:hypothetical protein
MKNNKTFVLLLSALSCLLRPVTTFSLPSHHNKRSGFTGLHYGNRRPTNHDNYKLILMTTKMFALSPFELTAVLLPESVMVMERSAEVCMAEGGDCRLSEATGDLLLLWPHRLRV